jgi:nitrate reductase (NAD(P)H)
VRTHGAVPRVDKQGAAGWTLKVHGLVEKELELTIEDLKKNFTVVSLPMTLACASSRRKEQNMVSQTIGFNWGPGALSTALFTGVYLADVLDAVKPIRGKAKHVVFEGADQLPNGPYGTSQKLSWAADRSKGMLIGELCEPFLC